MQCQFSAFGSVIPFDLIQSTPPSLLSLQGSHPERGLRQGHQVRPRQCCLLQGQLEVPVQGGGHEEGQLLRQERQGE